MKEYPTEKIRNIALVSHSGAGKTTFVERLLFDTGSINRMGSVTGGNTITDFEPEEIERGSSVSTAVAAVEFRGGKLNLFDTPGYIDFVGEVNAALKAADSAMVFVDASSGVEVGTEIVWAEASQRKRPMLLVANKMDRENVRASRVLASINENLIGDRRLVPLQLPIGEGVTFKGVADLITMKAYGKKGETMEIPADMLDAVEEAKVELFEAAAEGADSLMENYFENDSLTADEIIEGLKSVMAEGTVVPIVFCAGESGIATDILTAVMQRLMPSPNERTYRSADNEENAVSGDNPFSALVFKTREDTYGRTSYVRVFGGQLNADSRVWNMDTDTEARVGAIGVLRGKDVQNVKVLHAGDVGAIVKMSGTDTNHTLHEKGVGKKIRPIDTPNPIYSLAIHPVTQADTGKLSEAISRLQGEDPTLISRYDAATRESILSGMGDVHLGIAVKKLSSKFGVNVTTTTPKIPYRETCTGEADAEYTHKKQSGGSGQYGRVNLRVESLDDDAEFEFGSQIFGGSVSGPFVVATEKGCMQAIESGPIAGYPVTGVKAVIYDGKEHPVDSKEIAFQIAGRESFRAAMMKAGPVMLEPIYDVTVTVPADHMGDIMSDMNTRRARVQGMDQVGSKAVVRAEVPLAEMQRYLVDLRSMTAGRGIYSMAFARYGRVPSHMQDKIIAEAKHSADG